MRMADNEANRVDDVAGRAPARRPLTPAHRILIRMIAERIVDRHIKSAEQSVTPISSSEVVQTRKIPE